MNPCIRIAALVSALAPTATSQGTKIVVPDFAMTTSPKSHAIFDARLGRIRDVLLRGGSKTLPIATIAKLERPALKALDDEDPRRRMLAVRTLGTLTHLPGAMPHLQVKLTRAVQDKSRLVRREAILQLRDAPYRAAFMARDVQKLMLHVMDKHREDRDLCALAKATEQELAGVLLASLEARKKRSKAGKVIRSPKARTKAEAKAKATAKTKTEAKVDRMALISRRRPNANESAAIAVLKNISSAMAQCQASGVIDTDNDGRGEYGYFGELSGGFALRKDENGGIGDRRVRPPVLSGAFANVRGGMVRRSGYCFCVFLPGADGPVAEAKSGGGKGCRVKADLAEKQWCAYAWPSKYGASGSRVFFINQSGDVLAANNATTRYSHQRRPDPQAAFRTSDAKNVTLGAPSAANEWGRDGNLWIVVN